MMVDIKVQGGDKISAVLERIEAKLRNASTLRVGFLEGGTYPDGTSIPAVATFNEFGTGTQPPRPFFRNAVAANSHKWAPNLATAIKHTNGDVAKALKMLGLEIKGEIQQSIRDLVSPPLAKATIAAKGFDKPLIDTGAMLNSVKFTVN